jgi:hypothetical protein
VFEIVITSAVAVITLFVQTETASEGEPSGFVLDPSTPLGVAVTGIVAWEGPGTP